MYRNHCHTSVFSTIYIMPVFNGCLVNNDSNCHYKLQKYVLSLNQSSQINREINMLRHNPWVSTPEGSYYIGRIVLQGRGRDGCKEINLSFSLSLSPSLPVSLSPSLSLSLSQNMRGGMWKVRALSGEKQNLLWMHFSLLQGEYDLDIQQLELLLTAHLFTVVPCWWGKSGDAYLKDKVFVSSPEASGSKQASFQASLSESVARKAAVWGFTMTTKFAALLFIQTHGCRRGPHLYLPNMYY